MEMVLEAGHVNEGLGTLKARRPKGSEGCPEVSVREGPDELTLRAEEVEHVEVMHQCQPHGSVTGWITTVTPSVRRCTKTSKKKNGESCMMSTKKLKGLWD